MCFTVSMGRSTTNGTNRQATSNGLRTMLLRISTPKRGHPPKLPVSRLWSPYKNSEAIGKLRPRPESPARIALERPESPPKIISIGRDFPAEVKAIQASEAVEKTVPSSFSKAVEPDVMLSRMPSEHSSKHKKTLHISAKYIPKMNTKKVKGMMTGVGKELRRAANSVGDTLSEKIPTQTKKRDRSQKGSSRQELLDDDEPQKPQIRNPDEIKKAYGHTTDARYAAGMAHEKLRERGEKLSDIQRRTAELESDAAKFSSLAQELAKKMENRKWYEI